MTRTGGCNCGAVRFEVTHDVKEAGACHCGMCRKFSGGVYIATEIPVGGMAMLKEDGLQIYASSDWAERAFCKDCGSSLFYRVTAPGPMQGVVHLGIGSLDDANGIAFTGEIFIDRKPDGYSFAQDTKKMTEAEMMALFGG